MNMRDSITQERLKELIHYDPCTGHFKWIVKGRLPKIGYKTIKGYLQIRVDDILYMAHRLAWLYVHGIFPDKQIDHINRIKDDNRIINLRMVTNSENHQNMSIRKDNKSGHEGVTFCNKRKRWRAYITAQKKRYELGFFEKIEDAIQIRAAAKRRLHIQ